MLLAFFCVYTIGAGELPSTPMLVGLPLAFFLAPLAMRFGGTRSKEDVEKVLKTLPEPLGGFLRSQLDAAGLADAQAVYQDEEAAIYPRVLVTGNVAVFSRRIVAELSPAALAWSAKTELTTSIAWTKGLKAWFLMLLGGVLLLGFGQRFGGWLWIGSAGGWFFS